MNGNTETPENCVFCKIRRGEIPGEMLHSDDDCFVIRDINPASPTHLLIIPTRHFTYLSGLTDDILPVIGRMYMVAKQMAEREGVSESGYRLIVNQGEQSGQVVPHLHLHLIGGRQLGALG